MKLVSYLRNNKENLGIYLEDKIYQLQEAARQAGMGVLPGTMNEFLHAGEEAMTKAKAIDLLIQENPARFIPEHIDHLLAPVPHPTSCRDGYAFRQHVEAARRNRGVEMIAEFDEYPIFYFTNHNAIQGHEEDIVCMPDHFQKLDFELEAAIVVGKRGRNIKAGEADHYIAGYMIMNDMSARVLQMEEMKLNLGPAKGKDFSTVIGPYLVTPDEIEPYRIPAKDGHEGHRYNLAMKCWVNGKLVSEGNMADMDWSFAEILERCAYGTDIHPGDVIGSGTVGTGCFLELNGTGKRLDKNYTEQWLQDGDIVEMEIEGLGRIRNRIVKDASDFSLLKIKKIAKTA